MPAKAGMIAWITAFVRKNGSPVIVEALVNFVLPYVIYAYAEAPLGDVRALLASSVPPILWSLIEFARHRRVDALSVLVVGGIALSLLAMLGGGGVRFLQLREKLVTGLIGLAFLGSTLVGRPIIYLLARASMQRTSESGAQEFEALHEQDDFRRTMTVMTVVWGIGLLIDTAVSAIMVFGMSIRSYLLLNPIFSYAVLGALCLWTFLYGQWAGRRDEKQKTGIESPSAPAPTAEDVREG